MDTIIGLTNILMLFLVVSTNAVLETNDYGFWQVLPKNWGLLFMDLLDEAHDAQADSTSFLALYLAPRK